DAALAAAHADFERLLGDGLVREDADEQVAGALDVPLDGHAARLDLTRGHPAAADGLQREVSEGDVAATPGDPTISALLLLAALGALGTEHEHYSRIRRDWRCKTSPLKIQPLPPIVP